MCGVEDHTNDEEEHKRISLDADLGFIDPRAATDRTLTGLCQPVRLEHEIAGTAFCGNYRHAITGRFRGSDRMPQILLGIRALQTKVAGNRRHRPRLCGQELDQILSYGHFAHFRCLGERRRGTSSRSRLTLDYQAAGVARAEERP